MRDGEVEAFLGQLTPKQVEQEKGEHTGEHMDPHLLVRPMILGSKGNVVRVFHGSEPSFDVVLGTVGADNLGVAPLVVVREEKRLTQQGPL